MVFQDILANMALRIRQSLNLEQILKTTVAEVRQWLDSDRVIIYRFNRDWSGFVMVESVNNPEWSILGLTITDPCFKEAWINSYREGRITAKEDIYNCDLTPCHVEFLQQYQVRANLVVPILLDLGKTEESNSNPHLWGLLIAHNCSGARQWQAEEIDFLEQLATHVAIAIQQALLFEQLQRSKTELELRVTERTAELVSANEQLQQVNQELVKSNQELENFAYIASHDLREPLRMVISFTGLLGQRYKGQLDADADQFIDFAVNGATRMEALISDLLTYSRIGRGGKPFEPTDCEVVLDEALSNLQLLLEETGTIVKREALPRLMADGRQLVQLFQNLLNNAIKYRREQAEIEVGSEAQKGQWLFWVKDNGIGIAEQYFERIFCIFQRLHTKEEYPGTGIGLALCQKIVERHGGNIWVDSELGKGSVFYFTITDR